VLYYAEELSYDEIADIIKVPVGTVSSHLRRARQELKRMLELAAGASGSQA
jgi:RNA polymerase sigma factor (sigma-70 family)